jgi:hypothetical protein
LSDAEISVDWPEAYANADALRRERRIDLAMEAFVALARRAGEAGEAQWRDRAFGQALNCAARLKLWEFTESLARRAIAANPDLAIAHARLGEALIAAERRGEAVASLQQALALDPADEDARVLLHIARRPPAPPQAAPRTRVWPVRQAAFDDPAELVRRYLLRGHPAEFAIGPDTTFTTIGSCFAHSLGKRLKGAGYVVRNEEIGEEVNSPLANRELFAWIERGPASPIGETMEALFGAEARLRMRSALESSDVVVLTLGVAPCFFEATGSENGGGAFVFLPNGSSTARDYLQTQCVMRTTTVAENVAAIDDILAAIARISRRGAKVVLTVSPVPLSGSSEFQSAIVADCLSKSTLRLACHEAITKRTEGDVAYWPSFEIVRWLGGHFSPGTPPAFGADDGNTRHVSRWLVKMIVGLFLEHYAAGRPAAEGDEAAA